MSTVTTKDSVEIFYKTEAPRVLSRSRFIKSTLGSTQSRRVANASAAHKR